MTVTSTTDSETVTVTETGVNTGIFTASIASSTTAGVGNNNGTLNALGSTTITASHVSVGGCGSTTASALVQNLTINQKQLYFSPITAPFTPTTTGMDRVDPVATNDTSTSQSSILSVTVSSAADMAVWGRNGYAYPLSSVWNGTSFGTASNSANLTKDLHVIESAAAPTRNELIVVGPNDGTNTMVEVWNGSTWGNTLTLATAPNKNLWSGAVAYESLSGDAVLVYANNTNGTTPLSYRTWSGTSWSPATVITVPLTGQKADQLRLVAKPNSDEMILIVSDAQKKDYALVWNGSSWGNSVTLTTTASPTFTEINDAYESTSGDGLFVYGKNDTNVYYRTLVGGVWGAEQTLDFTGIGGAGKPVWTDMASDPNSNRIVLGVITDNDDAWLAVWDGTTWGSKLVANAKVQDRAYQNLAVAFESTSGEALAVYGTDANKPVVSYRTWTSGGGWSTAANDGNMGGDVRALNLYSDPGSNNIMLGTTDSDNDLNYTLWTGSTNTWGTPTELETNLRNTPQPFTFSWGRWSSGGSTSVTFTQVPAFAGPYMITNLRPTTVTAYIQLTSGSLPVNPNISATINDNGAPILTLAAPPTVTTINAGQGIYKLTWSGSLSATIAATHTLSATITNSIVGTAFQVLYDSTYYPSQISVPTADCQTA